MPGMGAMVGSPLAELVLLLMPALSGPLLLLLPVTPPSRRIAAMRELLPAVRARRQKRKATQKRVKHTQSVAGSNKGAAGSGVRQHCAKTQHTHVSL